MARNQPTKSRTPAAAPPAPPAAASSPTPAAPNADDVASRAPLFKSALDAYAAGLTWPADATDEAKALALNVLASFAPFLLGRADAAGLVILATVPDAPAPGQISITTQLGEIVHELTIDVSRGPAQLESLIGSAAASVVAKLRELTGLPASTDPVNVTLSTVSAGPTKGLIHLRVIGPRNGRYRAGHHFTPDPKVVAVTPADAAAIHADRSLSATPVSPPTPAAGASAS